MKVAVVVGTRPEAIKLAPVIHELDRCDRTTAIVISTGQHRELLDPILEQFGIAPHLDLGAMRARQELSNLASALIGGVGDAVRAARPDWVVVQGDTASVASAALAAFYEGTRVAHVEAGLRTRDIRSPFPEEAHRRIAGVLAELHFCPTTASRANLLSEGVPDDKVLVTGNTVIDALLWAVEKMRRRPPALPRKRARRILLTLHRRETQGAVMRRICDAVASIARRRDTEVLFPVHKSPTVREVVLPALADVDGVRLCEPLDYFTFVQVLDSCDFVLTDSGGVQEEAPSLAKPVLVLREETERPEAIDAGVAQLVGTEPDAIHRAAARLLDDDESLQAMARRTGVFGDGRASERIVAALLDAPSARAA